MGLRNMSGQSPPWTRIFDSKLPQGAEALDTEPHHCYAVVPLYQQTLAASGLGYLSPTLVKSPCHCLSSFFHTPQHDSDTAHPLCIDDFTALSLLCVSQLYLPAPLVSSDLCICF